MWGNLREGDHLEDSGVDGRVILKCIIETWNGWGGGHGLDRSGSGYGEVESSCLYGDELSGSIKCRDFLQ
jgi:hypothetical protein